MQLELVVSNESRVLGGARALVGETLRQLPLVPAHAIELETLVVGAVQDAVEHAYRPGEQGSIKLAIREQQGKLEITVRDFGIPRDVEQLERQLHSPQAPMRFSAATRRDWSMKCIGWPLAPRARPCRSANGCT